MKLMMKRGKPLASIFLTLLFIVAGVPGLSSTTARAQTRPRATADTIKEWPPSQKRYALIVGVTQYDDSRIYSLKAPSNDAIMLAEALKKYAGFPADHIVLLSTDNPKDLQPTRNIIIDYLSTLTRLAGNDGLFLFAFAGHGYELDGEAFLLGSDARLSTDLRVLRDTAVSWSGIAESIEAASVKQVVMLLDACRSDPRSGRSTPKPNRVSQIYSRGLKVTTARPTTSGGGTIAMAKLLAAQEGQEAFEDVSKKQGYFMAAIVEGLKGAAADATGRVTLKSLVDYVKDAVPKRVAVQGLTQIPVEDISYYDSGRLVIAEAPPDVTVKTQSKVSLFVVTNALDASISIKSQDGSLRQDGRIEKGKFTIDVAPGVYDVAVNAARYRPYSGKVTVEKGATAFERIDLAPTTGSILLAGSFSPDTNVLVDGRPVSTANKSRSEIQLSDIAEGRHTVTVSDATSEPWEQQVEVRGGSTISFPVILRRRLAKLTVKSQPGALIYVDGVLKDQVSESGRTKVIEVEPGLRKIKAVSNDYEPVEKAQTIAVGAAELDLALTKKIKIETPTTAPKQSALLIARTNVPAASVVIKSQGTIKRQGRSEPTGEFRAELDPGTYEVAVTADNYQPYSDTITIREGQPVRFLPVDLVPTTGAVTLIGSFEPDVNVLVDGRKLVPAKLRISNKQIEIKDLPIGSRTIQVEQPTFATPWSERVEVAGGMTVPVPVLYKPAVVNLTIKTEPGAEIYVDGSYKGKASETGKTGLIEVPPGEHTIKAVKAEYNATEQTRSFSPGEASVELKMTRVSFSSEFSDYFVEGAKFWSAPAGWEVNKGKLMVRGPGVGLLQEQIYKDFKMEFDISLANGKGAVWIVRARDQQNYYLFHLSGPKAASPATFRSYVCQNGQMKLLKTDRIVEDMSRPDEKYHIIIEARGPTIKHMIQLKSAPKTEGPQPLSALSDNTFSYGTVGFTTSDGEEVLVYLVSVMPIN